jgi:hypothetical protein
LVGPDLGAGSAEEEDDDMDLADLDAFLDDIFGEVDRTPKRRSGRPSRR